MELGGLLVYDDTSAMGIDTAALPPNTCSACSHSAVPKEWALHTSVTLSCAATGNRAVHRRSSLLVVKVEPTV